MGKKIQVWNKPIEYLGGLHNKNEECKANIAVHNAGVFFHFGFTGKEFQSLLWGDIAAINFTGSTNPAFKSVNKAVYGIPGLQSIQTKEVRTGAKTFMAISFNALVVASGQMRFSPHKGTVRFYIKDCSHNDIEVQFAQYMHLIGTNEIEEEVDLEDYLDEDLDFDEDEDLDDDSDDDEDEDLDEGSKTLKNNVSSELKDLVKMLDRGLLTESEFQKAKKRLLKDI